VHNLSDREYDYGHTKHELLSEAEIRSVERFAVFDSLKQYVFIGGGNKGDGVLRCPAAGEDEQFDLQAGVPGGCEDGEDADTCSTRQDMWDQLYPTDKGCEHYLLNSQSAAATPNRDGAAGDEQGAATVRWSPPPQGARARATGVHKDADEGETEQGTTPPSGGCMGGGGTWARRTASNSSAVLNEANQAQALSAPAASGPFDAPQEAGANPTSDSDLEDVFGHINLAPQSADSAARRSTGACLSTRRVQEGAHRAAHRENHRIHAGEGESIKEQDQGLICRILHVFMRETPDSTYRFWLASCVEAFLRGSDVRSQVLMARAGLLQHLVDGVLNSQGSGNLQTNFDLLGELIKCNPEVFALFNEILDDATYTSFMQVLFRAHVGCLCLCSCVCVRASL
jgi:hypothetical protein